MRKIQRFPFTPGFTRLQVVSTYSIQRIVNKLIHSTCTGKETPFRSEIDKTTSTKQTRSSYERKEIKTLVIFRTLFAQVSADSIRTHACSRIKYIVLYYSEQLIANVTYLMFSTSRTVLIRLAMYGTGFCSFLKINTRF